MDKGREVVVSLMRFEFGTGVYGFAKSPETITYNSVAYVPGGAIGVSNLRKGVGTKAQSFTLELASSGEDGLTPSALASIENEDYRDRPVYLMDAMFDPETGAQLHVETMERGYADTVDHKRLADGSAVISMTCENRALDYGRKNGRQANTSDQQKRNPTDTFFKNAAVAGIREVTWGK